MVLERQDRAGFALIILAAALWATVGVSVELAPEAAALGPDALGLLRLGLAGPAILIAWLATGRNRVAALRQLDPGRLVWFAASSALFQVCLFRCFDALGVAVTVFLTVCLPPVLAATHMLVRGKGGLGGGVGPALGCAAAGLALMSLPGREVHASGEGLLLALIASVAFVAMSGSARDLARAAPPLLVAGAGLTLSAILLGVATAVSSGDAVWTALQAMADPRLAWLALYLGLGPTALAYICYCAGMARCRSVASGLVVSMVEPAIAAALALAVLHETMRAAEIGGCGLVALAMVALWLAETRERRAAPA